MYGNLIISGVPRSYTSLTMQIFEGLGFPIAKDDFLDEMFNKFNKNGLYELSNTVVMGLRTNKYRGNVVKLSLGALFPNRINGHMGTLKTILHDAVVLLCLRKPIEVAQSARIVNPNNTITPLSVMAEFCLFLNWLKYNEWFLERLYVVDTDSYFTKPVETIKQLAKTFGAVVSDKTIDNIAKKITPKRTMTEAWPKECEVEAKFAEDLYAAMLEGNFKKAIEINDSRYGV